MPVDFAGFDVVAVTLGQLEHLQGPGDGVEPRTLRLETWRIRLPMAQGIGYPLATGLIPEKFKWLFISPPLWIRLYIILV